MSRVVQMHFEHDEPVEPSKINGTYYQAEGPADYILARMYALAAIGAETDGFLDLIAQGTEFHGVRISLHETSDEHDEEALGDQNQRIVDHYTRIELHALKHLAIETLLRLFMAHRGIPPCPWLEISRQTNFRGYKKAVKRTIVKGDREELVRDCAQLFLATDRVPADSPVEAREAADNLAGFLQDFASAWLGQAKSYNSTKHGLTAIPGSAVLDIGSSEATHSRWGEGDSLTHLTHEAVGDGERRWHMVTRWIRPREAMGTIVLVHLMLKALWSIARCRYGFASEFTRFALPPDVYSPSNLRDAESTIVEESSLPLFTELSQTD
ncbi:hypothetical protein [Candidatus Poriferisodalis sp.]|uniref:hypothetical protein n=1 Tax=Candidatus Poriferisodalis sp. TaxID=3101277 RepID=UPI003B5998CB